MPASSCGPEPPCVWLLLSSGKDAQVILTNIYLPKGLGKPNPLFGEEGGGAGAWELLARCRISSPPPRWAPRGNFLPPSQRSPKWAVDGAEGSQIWGYPPRGAWAAPLSPAAWWAGGGRSHRARGGADRGWVVGVPPKQPSTGKRCAPASEQGRGQRSLCGGFGLSLPAPALGSRFAWV